MARIKDDGIEDIECAIMSMKPYCKSIGAAKSVGTAYTELISAGGNSAARYGYLVINPQAANGTVIDLQLDGWITGHYVINGNGTIIYPVWCETGGRISIRIKASAAVNIPAGGARLMLIGGKA